MPEFNEENYLDSLLDTVDKNRSNPVSDNDNSDLLNNESENENSSVPKEDLEELIIKQQVKEADEKVQSKNFSDETPVELTNLDEEDIVSNMDSNRPTGTSDQSDYTVIDESSEDTIHSLLSKSESDNKLAETDTQTDIQTNNTEEKVSNESIDRSDSLSKVVLEKNTSQSTVESQEMDLKQDNEDMIAATLEQQEVSPLSNTSESIHNLSEDELSRLNDMNLDDIIEDVHSDSMSIEDIFQNHAEDTLAGKIGDQIGSLASDSIKAAGDIANSTVNSGVETTLNNIKDEVVADIETDKAISDAVGVASGLAGAVAELANDNDELSKKTKKKAKKTTKNVKEDKKPQKKKKNVFGVIKNIFFESLEDESSVNTKEAPLEAVKDAQTAGKSIVENDKTEKTSDIDSILNESNEDLDENEKLLQEMYGNKKDEIDLDAVAVPKKGFFAKLSYRIKEFKKKQKEQDKVEQEAENSEYQEKLKKKEEKKAAAALKKEANKEKAKVKKEKKPKEKKPKKPKKEKKPKAPPKPGDILKIKPASIVFFVLFIVGVIVLFLILNTGLHYSNSVNNAKMYIQNDNYEKAYNELVGVQLKKKDQQLFEKASVVMYVQGQYDSYENNLKNNDKPQALNSLIKGLNKYDKYYNEASNLGVRDELEQSKKEILSALKNTFNMSEAEASALTVMYDSDFTQYYIKIQSYEE